MKKNVLLSFLLVVFFLPLTAQKYSLGVTGGIGTVGSADVMISRNYYLGVNKKIIIAPAVRLNYAFATTQNYISAPAAITKVESNIDTLRVANTGVVAPNLAINLGYKFNEKFTFMFNIDLIGISFGGTQRSIFLPGTTSKAQGRSATALDAKTTSPNILLVGDNDHGTLNSSFAFHYNVNKRIAIKAGAGFLFTEYTSVRKLGATENDRYRYKAIQGVLGVNYNF